MKLLKFTTKTAKMFFALTLILTAALSFSSCSKDNEPKAEDNYIIVNGEKMPIVKAEMKKDLLSWNPAVYSIMFSTAEGKELCVYASTVACAMNTTFALNQKPGIDNDNLVLTYGMGFRTFFFCDFGNDNMCTLFERGTLYFKKLGEATFEVKIKDAKITDVTNGDSQPYEISLNFKGEVTLK